MVQGRMRTFWLGIALAVAVPFVELTWALLLQIGLAEPLGTGFTMAITPLAWGSVLLVPTGLAIAAGALQGRGTAVRAAVFVLGTATGIALWAAALLGFSFAAGEPF
jgi:hypothetical protein